MRSEHSPTRGSAVNTHLAGAGSEAHPTERFKNEPGGTCGAFNLFLARVVATPPKAHRNAPKRA
jgi:hypothetical protein